MPEDLKIQFPDPNALTRYEAQLKDYLTMKQEIQVTGRKVSIRLPVYSEKSLLAVIRAELSVSEEEADMGSIV